MTNDARYSHHHLLAVALIAFLCSFLAFRGCVFQDPFPERHTPIKAVEVTKSDDGEVVTITWTTGIVRHIPRKVLDQDTDLRTKVGQFVESKAGVVEKP